MTRLAGALLAALLLTALLPAGALAKKKSPEDIAAYWTDERMRDAKPRERAKPGGGGGGGKTTDWTRYTVPTPYTGETAKNGKLFFTIDGSRYVCSGTAVDAASGVNLVWTAGHCVTDGVDAQGVAHDATDVLFVPGYLNGSEPYGRWAATSTDATDAWELSGGSDFRYDFGAARVTQVVRDSSGAWVPNPSATFAGTIGTRDIVFTTPLLGQKVVSYGYPASGRFSGNQQYACASTLRQFDPWNPAPPAPFQIGCDMTGGSSGGGWVRDDDADRAADANEPLVSVNSYGYGFEKSTMYGPQIGTVQASALYSRVSAP